MKFETGNESKNRQPDNVECVYVWPNVFWCLCVNGISSRFRWFQMCRAQDNNALMGVSISGQKKKKTWIRERKEEEESHKNQANQSSVYFLELWLHLISLNDSRFLPLITIKKKTKTMTHYTSRSESKRNTTFKVHNSRVCSICYTFIKMNLIRLFLVHTKSTWQWNVTCSNNNTRHKTFGTQNLFNIHAKVLEILANKLTLVERHLTRYFQYRTTYLMIVRTNDVYTYKSIFFVNKVKMVCAVSFILVFVFKNFSRNYTCKRCLFSIRKPQKYIWIKWSDSQRKNWSAMVDHTSQWKFIYCVSKCLISYAWLYRWAPSIHSFLIDRRNEGKMFW